MSRNIHQAVGIIAALSLLLGLSLGQLHDQYRSIRKAGVSSVQVEVKPFIRSGCGWNKHRHRRHRVDNSINQLQFQVELEKAMLEKERIHLLEEMENMRQDMERDHTPLVLPDEL